MGLWKKPIEGAYGVGLPAPQSRFVEETSLVQTLAWQDFYGIEGDILTRETALQVAAVSRGRALICGAVNDVPIFAYKGADRITTQPAWTYRTDSGVTPLRLWTSIVDDFIFFDESLLAFKLGADGYPVDIMRISYSRWSITNGEIHIDGEAVNPAEVMYVAGPGGGGLLRSGGQDIKAARALSRAALGRAISPAPLIELHQINDDELEQAEVDQLVEGWAKARASVNGAVGFTDNRVEVRVHGDKGTNFFEDARNASRTDIANHLNIPAALLDGSPNTASLTYETREGQSAAFWDQTVPYWLGPLEAALSSDRVVPRGTKVRFDFTEKRGPVSTPAIAGPEIQD